MNCSTSGLRVHHQLPESTQTHVHWVSDAIQPSHPLLSPSPPAYNLSRHQGLFKWVSSLHQVAKVLEVQLQHQSFPDWWEEHPVLISFRMDRLDLLAANAGDLRDMGSIPGWGRSPAGGHGNPLQYNPLQYSCPENPMDKGAWQATVHGVTKSWTRLKWLSTYTYIMNHTVLFVIFA